MTDSQPQGSKARSGISVQTVIQGTSGDPFPLIRQQHRVALGTSIRLLLQRAGLQTAIAPIEAGELGLACHGRRAWLDDLLADGARVEIVHPIHADAKASRADRVTADRRRRQARFGSKS